MILLPQPPEFWNCRHDHQHTQQHAWQFGLYFTHKFVLLSSGYFYIPANILLILCSGTLFMFYWNNLNLLEFWVFGWLVCCDRISLWSLELSVDQADLGLRDLPLPLPPRAGIKGVCHYIGARSYYQLVNSQVRAEFRINYLHYQRALPTHSLPVLSSIPKRLRTQSSPWKRKKEKKKGWEAGK